MSLTCFQATAGLTSKHFAQRQPWWRCAAATPRSMEAVSNWSWMSPPLSWDLVTSARPWGQSSQPPRGPWLPQAEPCPLPSGPCWPTLSPWCWKLCSESSPMLSVLTGTTHMVRYLGPRHVWLLHVFHFPGHDFFHFDSLLPCHLSLLLARFLCWLIWLFVSLSPHLITKVLCSTLMHWTRSLWWNTPSENAEVIAQRLDKQSSCLHFSDSAATPINKSFYSRLATMQHLTRGKLLTEVILLAPNNSNCSKCPLNFA